MASTTRKRKTFELPVAQFIAVIVLSISVFLIIDFGRRAATGYRVKQEERRLEAQYALVQQAHNSLLTRREYVQTDVYVEEAARSELKWSRPGETVIVVLATPQTAPKPPPVEKQLQARTPQNNTPLQAWITLFFSDE